MLRLVLCGLLIGVLCAAVYADTIVLANGGKLHGKIVKETEKEVTIQLPNKGIITVKRDQIVSMEKNEIEGPKIPPPSKSPLVPEDRGKKDEEDAEKEEGEEKPETPESGKQAEEDKIDPELQKRIDQLVEQLGHPKPGWRSNARAELSRIGKAAEKALMRALDTAGTSYQRWGAAQVLGNIRSEKATEQLIGKLRDPDRFVRKEAGEALKKTTGQNFGFDPFASSQNRDVSIKRWEEWWEKEKETKKQEEEKKKAEQQKKEAAKEPPKAPRKKEPTPTSDE